MTKKNLNQNDKYYDRFIDDIEPQFVFGKKPIDRLVYTKNIEKTVINKSKKLLDLRKRIDSIEDCNLKINAKNLVFGNGDINSSIMLIGEAPGEEEDKTGFVFEGEVGRLLKKMLNAINIDIKKIYLTYSVNFRIPDDKKPTVQEIKRYSNFLRDHISIINPKIIILMGGTAMESVTGLKNKVSDERGKWNEIILRNTSIPIMITYSPSYLIRFPEFKKYSWMDLKKIREKIIDLNIKI